MESTYIDINADVGEGFNNEASLLPLISSCNIACGGHAGDEQTMQTVIRLAQQYDVNIGAHPSYPDREYFGRKPMNISNMDLSESIADQINALLKVVHNENAHLHHVKPHGALYNKAMKDQPTAIAIILAMKTIALPLKLYAPQGSVLAREAERQGIDVIYEAFADRNYNEDLSLVSRNESEALITDSERMFDHVYGMITKRKVRALNGVEVEIKADTFCVHGDQPDAVKLVQVLTENLKKNHILIR